jgi:hypothetical protein
MVSRPLLYLLFAVLLGAGGYWVVWLTLGGLGDDPYGKRPRAPEWPVPANAGSHRFWGAFDAMRGPDRDARRRVWLDLLGADRGDLPHPAARPSDWPLADRVFVRALLWRLWRGRSFRHGGLELRVDRADDEVPRAGGPCGLRLTMAPVAYHRHTRFPRDLAGLLAAGADLYWLASPESGRPCVPLPAPAREPVAGGGAPQRIGKGLVLAAPGLAALPWGKAGDVKLRVVLDLTHAAVEDDRVPRGVWVSAPVTFRVEDAEADGG